MIAHELRPVQVWVATAPIDMRKSFDGLAEVVRTFLKADPLSGSLFVFRKRGGHLVRILWWDTNGLTIYYKQLQRGVVALPAHEGDSLLLTAQQLTLILVGVDLQQTRPRKRYRPPG